MKNLLVLFLSICAFALAKNPEAILQTNLGEIKIELYPDKAPITVENFINYAKNGFYNNTIFHRVIKGFMVQGGGLTADFAEKPTRGPIKNEADNGLKNKRGAVSMARTGVVDSATAQFFINTADNSFLNFKQPTMSGYGYCVFGKVVAGMDVVDKIESVQTGSKKGFEDVPLNNVIIERVTISQ